MRKRRQKKVKWFAQGHTDIKWKQRRTRFKSLFLDHKEGTRVDTKSGYQEWHRWKEQCSNPGSTAYLSVKPKQMSQPF